MEKRAAKTPVPLDILERLYHLPLFDLISQSRAIYLSNWAEPEVQLCSLLSIKTGGCSEDCSYCAQSAHYNTEVEADRLISREKVMEAANRAKAEGATRFCMGAAWKGVSEKDAKLDAVCDIIGDVSKLGMEVCVTLGQLDAGAARRLKEAGVTAYNHNIDTSPEYYPEIVTSHTFADRIATIREAQAAGVPPSQGFGEPGRSSRAMWASGGRGPRHR